MDQPRCRRRSELQQTPPLSPFYHSESSFWSSNEVPDDLLDLRSPRSTSAVEIYSNERQHQKISAVSKASSFEKDIDKESKGDVKKYI